MPDDCDPTSGSIDGCPDPTTSLAGDGIVADIQIVPPVLTTVDDAVVQVTMYVQGGSSFVAATSGTYRLVAQVDCGYLRGAASQADVECAGQQVGGPYESSPLTKPYLFTATGSAVPVTIPRADLLELLDGRPATALHFWVENNGIRDGSNYATPTAALLRANGPAAAAAVDRVDERLWTPVPLVDASAPVSGDGTVAFIDLEQRVLTNRGDVSVDVLVYTRQDGAFAPATSGSYSLVAQVDCGYLQPVADLAGRECGGIGTDGSFVGTPLTYSFPFEADGDLVTIDFHAAARELLLDGNAFTALHFWVEGEDIVNGANYAAPTQLVLAQQGEDAAALVDLVDEYLWTPVPLVDVASFGIQAAFDAGLELRQFNTKAITGTYQQSSLAPVLGAVSCTATVKVGDAAPANVAVTCANGQFSLSYAATRAVPHVFTVALTHARDPLAPAGVSFASKVSSDPIVPARVNPRFDASKSYVGTDKVYLSGDLLGLLPTGTSFTIERKSGLACDDLEETASVTGITTSVSGGITYFDVEPALVQHNCNVFSLFVAQGGDVVTDQSTPGTKITVSYNVVEDNTVDLHVDVNDVVPTIDAFASLVTASINPGAAADGFDVTVRDDNGAGDLIANGVVPLTATLTGVAGTGLDGSGVTLAPLTQVLNTAQHSATRGFSLAWPARIKDGTYTVTADFDPPGNTYSAADVQDQQATVTVGNVAPTLTVATTGSGTGTAGEELQLMSVPISVDDANWGGYGNVAVTEIAQLRFQVFKTGTAGALTSSPGLTIDVCAGSCDAPLATLDEDDLVAGVYTASLADQTNTGAGAKTYLVRITSAPGLNIGSYTVRAQSVDDDGQASTQRSVAVFTLVPPNAGFGQTVSDGGNGVQLTSVNPGQTAHSANDPVTVAFTGTVAAERLVVRLSDFVSGSNEISTTGATVRVYDGPVTSEEYLTATFADGEAVLVLPTAYGAAGGDIRLVFYVPVPVGTPAGSYSASATIIGIPAFEVA